MAQSCIHCQAELPARSRFCSLCGGMQWPIDFKDLARLPQQLKGAFFLYMQQEAEDLGLKAVDLGQEDGFRLRYLEERLLQLAYWIEQQDPSQQEELRAISEEIDWQFRTWAEAYFLQEGREQLPQALPQSLQSYQQMQRGENCNLRTLIANYLQSDKLPYAHSWQAIDWPKKLKTAGRKFFSALGQEELLFFLDPSMRQLGRRGFILTPKGLYWRQSMSQGRSARFSLQAELQLKKQILYINGQVFDVQAELNLNLYFLFKRLALLS